MTKPGNDQKNKNKQKAKDAVLSDVSTGVDASKPTPGGEQVTPDVSDQRAEEEKPFDFGGLPDRNLKKNLGCG